MRSTNGRPEPGSGLLEVSGLTIAFPAGDTPLLAADRVGFSVKAGRPWDWSGNRVAARASPCGRCWGWSRIPGEVLSGEIRWLGEDLAGVQAPDRRGPRRRDRHDLPGPDLVR